MVIPINLLFTKDFHLLHFLTFIHKIDYVQHPWLCCIILSLTFLHKISASLLREISYQSFFMASALNRDERHHCQICGTPAPKGFVYSCTFCIIPNIKAVVQINVKSNLIKLLSGRCLFLKIEQGSSIIAVTHNVALQPSIP